MQRSTHMVEDRLIALSAVMPCLDQVETLAGYALTKIITLYKDIRSNARSLLPIAANTDRPQEIGDRCSRHSDYLTSILLCSPERSVVIVSDS